MSVQSLTISVLTRDDIGKTRITASLEQLISSPASQLRTQSVPRNAAFLCFRPVLKQLVFRLVIANPGNPSAAFSLKQSIKILQVIVLS